MISRLLIPFMTLSLSLPAIAAEKTEQISVSKFHKLHSSTLRVFEPHERKKIEFRGFNAKAALDKLFGPRWRKSEIVIFVCADGYKVPVPTAKLVEQNALLATQRLDQKSFSLIDYSQNGNSISLGQLFLVWDNLKSQYESEESTYWPYQVTAIELASFAEKFPKIIPPPNSSDRVRYGFSLFQQYCLSCHKINGEGGDKGGELNSPVSVFAKRSQKDLHAWIDKPGPGMPAFTNNVKDRDAAIDAVISYLGAMSKVK